MARSARMLVLVVAVLIAGAAHAAAAGAADRAYVTNATDLRGNMLVLRTSADGSRLTFLSASIKGCPEASVLQESFKIVVRAPAKLPAWTPVLVGRRLTRGRLDARLLRRMSFVEGVETWSGRLSLRGLTRSSVRGSWNITVRWAPKGGAVRRCTMRGGFAAHRDGHWYVGQTDDAAPVAVHEETGSVYVMIPYFAGCPEGFVTAIYAAPLALDPARAFGWTDPQQYVVSALRFNPAQVVVNGRLDGTQASGNFSLTVDWPGEGTCATGAHAWTALRG